MYKKQRSFFSIIVTKRYESLQHHNVEANEQQSISGVRIQNNNHALFIFVRWNKPFGHFSHEKCFRLCNIKLLPWESQRYGF